MPPNKRGFVLKCSTCDATTHEINTSNEMVAQRIALTHLHWKVYKQDKRWLRACPACVKKFKRKEVLAP